MPSDSCMDGDGKHPITPESRPHNRHTEPDQNPPTETNKQMKDHGKQECRNSEGLGRERGKEQKHMAAVFIRGYQSARARMH